MATYAEHAKRLAHLRALCDQSYAQNGFSECIEQCERSLEVDTAPYRRIKTLCLLVRSHQHDWKKANEWLNAGENLYWSFLPDDPVSRKEPRADLNDLNGFFSYQVKDTDSWYSVKEKLNRSGTGVEAAASGKVGEMEADKSEEAIKKSGAIEGAEEAAAVQDGESSDVDPIDEERTWPVESAVPDGGAKKKSFRSWMGHIVKRTQDGLAKRDQDKTSTSRLDFDKQLKDAIQQMHGAALEDRKAVLEDSKAALEDFKRLRQDFNDKAQRMQEDFNDKVQQM